MTIVIDQTHLGRRASGIERVTQALFSEGALAPLPIRAERARPGKLGLLLKQTVTMPAAAAMQRGSVWVFPGFPPSPAFALLRERAVLYVHDVFLLTRRGDLNMAGKYWMAPNFRIALGRFKHFMANSAATAAALRPFISADAGVFLYRPGAENVFGLTPRARGETEGGPLKVGAIGTVEPRKNFPRAAAICERLAALTGRPVELHIVGRKGWGEDFAELAAMPHVKLHGFLPDEEARAVIESFDLLICTSHDEGLCLPLLEAQFAGLPIVAPDKPVFREVLAASGVYIHPEDVEASAQVMAELIAAPGWRERGREAAASNIGRWNALAADDRVEVVAFLAALSGEARR